MEETAVGDAAVPKTVLLSERVFLPYTRDRVSGKYRGGISSAPVVRILIIAAYDLLVHAILVMLAFGPIGDALVPL